MSQAISLSGSPPTGTPKRRISSARAKAARAQATRQAIESAAPRQAQPTSWADPIDACTAKTPKQVKGFTRGNALRRLAARGSSDITRDHLDAADALACAHDGARIGYSGPVPVVEALRVGKSSSPSMGPNHAALRQEADNKLLRRVLVGVGPAARPLLIHVVLCGRDVASFANAHPDPATGKRPCPKKLLGRLTAHLDRLVEILNLESSSPRRAA